MEVKDILEVKKCKSYIEYHKYHAGNIFGITRISRSEEMHSNFIAWLLNPNKNGSLGSYSIVCFIEMLLYVYLDKRSYNNKTRFNESLIYQILNNKKIKKVNVTREKSCTIGKKKRRVDVVIEIELFDNKILPIVIENKVKSDEHTNQTIDYFKWGEDTYKDKAKFYDVIYIFLTPQFKSKTSIQEEYLSIKYQDLVNYVIEPSLWYTNDEIIKNNINMYLQCLSYQTDFEKGDEIMAMSKEEQKIIDDFIAENQQLLNAVIEHLGLDSKTKEAVKTGLSEKDRSKYSFNGEPYGKGPLVLAVVKQYVEDNPTIKFEDLEKTFPKSLCGTYDVVALENKIPDKNKGIGGQKRYFMDDLIPLSDGSEVAVTNYWGKENIYLFIDNAIKLGYVIEKVDD